MEDIIPILFVSGVVVLLVTLVGHGIWVLIAAFFRTISGSNSESSVQELSLSSPASYKCLNCGFGLRTDAKFCGVCGASHVTPSKEQELRELNITLRQLEKLHWYGDESESHLEKVKARIAAAREAILFPNGRPAKRAEPAPVVETPAAPVHAESARAPFITPITFDEPAAHPAPPFAEWSKDSDEPRAAEPVVKPPRKPWTDVLAAFMEQSNVRWGEIIGGLLIIGCSTALVISLWAQISRVPVMKFLIFTTVTAALFGVGFYTEHHWKLPTTSRGILTIATLLVPLNFLAIAAVSANVAPSGSLVIGSEIIAPVLFLSLVYFAGRTITSKWPHLLAAGALGSSAGQLLVRHFADPAMRPIVLIALAAVPIACYVVASAWMMKLAFADGEIDEDEATQIFTALGALTFAAVLPFGLLLYKAGPLADSMMHTGPLVTLGSMPMLGSGMLLWRRASKKESVATRTAGASIAILGALLAVAGMILAWPNPASIIPAALFNFGLFTVIAILFGESRGHLLAAACLTFGYVIAFHVFAGHAPWQNLQEVSLLRVISTAGTGQALAVPFVVFLLTHEWLRTKREADALSYLIAASAVAVASVLILSWYGVGISHDPFHISAILALYSTGAFWFGWRTRRATFAWAGAALLFFTSAQVCHSLLSLHFPSQASCLFFSAAAVGLALVAHRFLKPDANLFAAPLRMSAMTASVFAAVLLAVQLVWFDCEPATVFATRLFVLATVCAGLLVLTQSTIYFASFQVAFTLGAILLTKTVLQRFAWYGFEPRAWLHPWALQTQGIVLALICLAWIAVRVFIMKRIALRDDRTDRNWWKRILLETPVTFDRLLAAALVLAFAALMIFGAASGISKELTSAARSPLAFDLGGFSHTLIFGVGSLVLLALLTAAMFGNYREHHHEIFVVGMLVTFWCVCPLIAGRFEAQFATASAARWILAVFLLTGAIAYAMRAKLAGWKLIDDGILNEQFKISRALLLFLTVAPLIFLTLSPVVDDVNYVPGRGPQAGVFHAMNAVLLYGVPLLLVAVALAIYAVRDRSFVFAFATGIFVNFAVTTVHIVSVAGINGAMNRVVLVNSIQLNAIAAGSVALIWMATRGWWIANPQQPAPIERVLLTTQQIFAIALTALFIVPLFIHLVALPSHVSRATFAAGGLIGWLALLLTIAAAVGLKKVLAKPITAAGAAASLLAIASIASFGFAQVGVRGWAGFHFLLGSVVIITWVLLLLRDLPRNAILAREFASAGVTLDEGWTGDCEFLAACVAAIVIIVALRGPFADPLGAWWSIGALLMMSALGTSLNWTTLRRGYLYAAGILFNVAVSIWLVKYSTGESSLSAFIEVNVIALSLAGVLWLLLELRARRAAPEAKGKTAPSFHHVAALSSLFAIAAVIALRLFRDLLGLDQSFFPVLDALAVASIVTLMFACLWDREAKYATAGLYILGLLGAVTFLHHQHLSPRNLFWSLTMAAAIQTLATAILWRFRTRLVGWATDLRIPERINPEAQELWWLVVFNSIVVAFVTIDAFCIGSIYLQSSLRVLAAFGVVIQCATFALMAGGQRHRELQRGAIAMALIGVVFVGWSLLMPNVTATWLNRAVILMAIAFATIGLFGVELDKLVERKPDWTAAFRDCVPAITIAGIVSLIFVLCTEVYYQIEFGAVRVKLLALAAVAATLLASVVVCIFFALSPTHDPLTLPDRRRGAYVYVAEILTVLLFMHIRLTMPWLFHGFFQRYWPLVVLAIAYAGVSISEFLKRREVPVLARPIERTGAFLPLLPVIGFWVAQSQVEYSTLLFVVGGLYGLLSILRRSFLFGLAAALAGNGGLWYLLHETSDYHFYQHPQLWVIPAAISVLIAAHLNRKDFSESQSTAIRYLCLATIYVSSTADIFLNGVASSPWLPLVLAGLSVAGVFAGMIFRIRAFLLLGSTFLLLAIATMIKYASVNFGWTWLWYVAGIFTGAAIITTFAVFEKKRAEVLAVVDGLKDWKG